MSHAIKKEGLPEFLASLQKKFLVMVPAKNPLGATCFQAYEGQGLFLGTRTDFSPKKFFLPPKEKMFSFKKKSLSYGVSQETPSEKRIIFGIRPCDTHALAALDALFLKDSGQDPFYAARRKNTILIALQCNEACENGFCTSMGTSRPTGHDLLFIGRGQDFFVVAETAKGRALLGEKFFKPTRDAAPTSEIKCATRLETGNLAENLRKNFSHPVWAREAERCLSCTSCTQSCPTCYCYTTSDDFEFGSGTESSRSRQPDSCQLKRFTEVAGGHVFRESRAARLRQFVLHKLSYYRKNHGTQLCVGCGRCISACPAKISIASIANEIQKTGALGE
jgi:ferredoxin